MGCGRGLAKPRTRPEAGRTDQGREAGQVRGGTDAAPRACPDVPRPRAGNANAWRWGWLDSHPHQIPGGWGRSLTARRRSLPDTRPEGEAGPL